MEGVEEEGPEESEDELEKPVEGSKGVWSLFAGEVDLPSADADEDVEDGPNSREYVARWCPTRLGEVCVVALRVGFDDKT